MSAGFSAAEEDFPAPLEAEGPPREVDMAKEGPAEALTCTMDLSLYPLPLLLAGWGRLEDFKWRSHNSSTTIPKKEKAILGIGEKQTLSLQRI